MAYNQYMHPRNVYKNNPPDFTAMAAKYPEFRKHCRIDAFGKISFDFKNPDAVTVLTKTLLEKDFNLNVEIPSDSLVPRLPARLNYLLWLQDLVEKNFADEDVYCIDIGTGASCIYPLLGVKVCKWNFIAVEALPANAECAKRNVNANRLSSQIRVIPVTKEDSLSEVIKDLLPTKLQLWMCNPPFFDIEELEGSRSVIPRDPHSATVGKPEELRTEGGEVQFVIGLIEESVKLGTKVRMYTSLLGRKASLRPVLSKLQSCAVKQMCHTFFGQGKTLRWAVAWTFDDHVSLEQTTMVPKEKKAKEQSYECLLSDSDLQPFTIEAASNWLENVFSKCQINYENASSSSDEKRYFVRASVNTWVGNRRKRRAAEQLHNVSSKISKPSEHGATAQLLPKSEVTMTNEKAQQSARVEGKPIVPELRLEVVVKTTTSNQIRVTFKFISGPNPDLVHQLKQYSVNILRQS